MYPENCESSAIYHISLNPSNGELVIVFRTKSGQSSNLAYHYQVGMGIADIIQVAPSKGAIISRLIKSGQLYHHSTKSL